MYASHFTSTPQSEQALGKNQVQNNAGGFVFQVDNWQRLDRWLLLGCEGGTFYCSERKMTIDNAQCVLRCAKADSKRTVARIVEISESGRAPKNDPAIFALAICAGEKVPEALDAIPRVCRIGTHLFQFVDAVEKFRGHGRALNRALQNWYLTKSAKEVAFGAMKYQQRGGWSHRDILRLARPKASGDMNSVLHWIVKGWDSVGDTPHDKDDLRQIWAFEKAKKADAYETGKLIREYDLPRECVPTQHLTQAPVWEALLEKMPLHAMIRNLATMTRVGLLAPMSQAVSHVIKELADGDRIKKSRLHPVSILAAMLTYQAGRGERSANTWTPVSQIVDALDGAFYKSFANVESTGKRWMLALDVSGSMDCGTIAGVPGLSPRVGAAAMSLVTAATEPQHMFAAFSHHLVDLAISPRQRLDDVCKIMRKTRMGGTDCALPMIHALGNKIPVDVFVILTDNETWFGKIHPFQALKDYRQKMGIAAKMIVVGMTATQFSIADSSDPGSLDVVGFDTSVPQLMNQFVMG